MQTVDIERFWSKVMKSSNCWFWIGNIDRKGYGYFSLKESKLRAHRLAYELSGQALDQDKQLDHLCRVRACVNPSHLEPTTNRQNHLRAAIFRHKRNDHTPTWVKNGFNALGNPMRKCSTCAKVRTA